MTSDLSIVLPVIVIATFLGAIVKGATNLGLNLLAVPALAPLIGVPAAVLTIFVPKLFSDIVMLLESKGERGFREGTRVLSLSGHRSCSAPGSAFVCAAGYRAADFAMQSSSSCF